MWNRIFRALTAFNRFQDRLFYLPALALIAALDLFLLLVPTDWLIVTSVLVQPKKWWKTALWVAIGSSLGALALGFLVIYHRDWVMTHLNFEAAHSKLWQKFDFEHLVDVHGLWALALLSFSILPQQPGVVIAAMGGMSATKIFLAVFIGRLTKYLIVAYITSHAPRLLVKWHIVPKKHAGDIEILEHEREEIEAHRPPENH